MIMPPALFSLGPLVRIKTQSCNGVSFIDVTPFKYAWSFPAVSL
jgi:hypothetical protein